MPNTIAYISFLFKESPVLWDVMTLKRRQRAFLPARAKHLDRVGMRVDGHSETLKSTCLPPRLKKTTQLEFVTKLARKVTGNPSQIHTLRYKKPRENSGMKVTRKRKIHTVCSETH